MHRFCVLYLERGVRQKCPNCLLYSIYLLGLQHASSVYYNDNTTNTCVLCVLVTKDVMQVVIALLENVLAN